MGGFTGLYSGNAGVFPVSGGGYFCGYVGKFRFRDETIWDNWGWQMEERWGICTNDYYSSNPIEIGFEIFQYRNEIIFPNL
jgi:hypothetical protein